MSVLFCHDHRFVIGNEGVYSPGQYDQEILSRYQDGFGEVFIAGRHRPLAANEDSSRLNRVLDSTERFLSMPNLSNLQGLLGRSPSLATLEQRIAAVDVVVARLPSEIGLAAARITRRLGKPLAIEMVACARDGLLSHGSLAARLYAPLAYSRTRRAVANCPWVLYVTQQFLQSRYPAGGRWIGVSDVRLPQADPVILERRLGRISDGSIRIGMVAALFHKEKGVDVAIRALALARQTSRDLTLKVLGPGDPTPLQKLAEELGVGAAVEFCGSLPRGPAVMEWLDGIDVYVQASFQEGLPRALIEAMSRAVPALASAAGGTPELLPPAYLHTPGDVTALAAHMLSIRDPETRTELARQLFLRSQEYTPDRIDPRRAQFWSEMRAAYGLAEPVRS